MQGGLTRRQILSIAPAAALAPALAAGNRGAVTVPVRLVVDGLVKWKPGEIDRFQSGLWGEAVRDLLRCGVRLETTRVTGEVARPPYREPVISGINQGSLNFVITSDIPVQWDGGRALCGVTTLYRGYHLCMVAFGHAHGHQLPFFSVNTCLHEVLHALMGDIFENRPRGAAGQAREARIDYHATCLWMFGGDAAVRSAAEKYTARLRAGQAAGS
jgi:hypothetical protein